MEKTKKRKPINVMTKSALVAVMIGTGVGSGYTNANAAEGNGQDNDQSKQSQGSGEKASIPVNVDNSKLEKAVKDAEDAGVKVTKDKDKVTNTTPDKADQAKKDVQADTDKQVKALEEQTKKAKDVKKKNDEAEAKYKKDMDAYEKKLKEVKDNNKKKLDKYHSKIDKEKKAVKDAEKNPQQPKYSAGAGNKFTPSGSWTNLKSKTVDNDIHLASSGKVNSLKDLQNGNYAIHAYSDKKGKITNDNIIQKISWGNTAPKGKTVTKGDKLTDDAKKKVPGYQGSLYNTSGKGNQFGKTTQLHSVKTGQWVTIPNAIHLANGKTKDVQVKFSKSGTKLDYGGDWVTFWNEGGSINYYDGSHDINNTPPKETITANYRVAGDTNSKYLWTGATFDIDAGQALTMNDKNYAILSMGGGLNANGNDLKRIKSDDNLGKTWGKAHDDDNFLNGTKSVPDGTVVFAKYDNEISHSVSNTGVPKSTLVANGDFGLNVNTSIAEYPKLEKEPKKPEKPTPEKVDTTANYHLNKLNVTPTNHKDVEKGIQKEDTKATINGQEVKVGDDITYPLTNSALPADRKDDMKSYVVKDELPEGVEPNKEAIEKNVDKDKWDVKVDGQKVTYTATKDYLEQMNKDKSKKFDVADIGLVATVTKGGDANLDNTFDTEINNKPVHSNQVSNKPPKVVKQNAKKSVSTDKILDFNKKYQYGLDFTIPNDKKYKDIEIKDSDMTKGSIDFDKVTVKQGDKDITDQGKLKLDKDKDTFSWKPNDPKKFLGESVHVDVEAKVKPGTDLSKYKTNEKDDNGNAIYKLPDVGHLVLDGKDVPTNKVHVKVTEIPGQIKKSIIEDDELKEHNKADFGDDIRYNLDTQFANNEKGDNVFVKDELEKDVLDINKDVHVYADKDQFKDDEDKDDNDKADASKDDKDAKDADNKDNTDKDNSDDKDTAKSDDQNNKDDDNKDTKDDQAKDNDKDASDKDQKDTDKQSSDDKQSDKADADKDNKDDDAKEAGQPDQAADREDVNADEEDNDKDAKSDDQQAKDDQDGKNDASDDQSSKDDNDAKDNQSDDASKDQSDDKDQNDDQSKDQDKQDGQADKDDAKDDAKDADDEDQSAQDKADQKDDQASDKDGNKAPNVKDMEDITKEGTLKVDEDNESFVWTPKDPSKFKGKKVVVQVGAKFKKDNNGNYKKYKKDGKYIVPNVAQSGSGDKDKVKKSNKVDTELKPKEKQQTPPPKKEQPKKEQPQKGGGEQPKQQPKQTVAQQSDLPSTGSNEADFGIIGAIVAAVAGAVGYIFNRKRKGHEGE